MLDRVAFNADPDVCQFVDWAVHQLMTLPIRLNVSPSWAVPRGLRIDVTGLPAAHSHYIWKARGTTTGDWAETVRILNGFRASLHAAIDNEDAAAGLKTCMEIIAWGGDRSSARGAVPFLRELADQNTLLAYLAATRADLALSTAQLGAPLHVKKMNSMLTKVHAMASEDGLPIYDSRVAAAIAALVEVWRRVQGTSASPLPALLTFPATSRERTVRDMAADAMLPGVMSYEPSYEARTARSWSEAKIRLGWLMQRILADAPGLFKGSMPERMHAFEASLFMIGYDVACLNAQAAEFSA